MFLKYNPQMREGDLKELRGAPLSVYIGIASHMNWDAQSFPSLETLSRETGYSVRRVKEALHFLKERDFITPVRAKKWNSTVYQVNHWFSIGRNGKGAIFEEHVGDGAPTKGAIFEEHVGDGAPTKGAIFEEHVGDGAPTKKNIKKNIEEDISISSTYNNSSLGEMECPHEDKIAPDLWEKVKARVKEEITRGNYETWIKDTKGLRFSDSTIVVGVPSDFIRKWLERRFQPLLEKEASNVLGRRIKVLCSSSGEGSS